MKLFAITAVPLLAFLPTFLWAQAGCGTDCGNVGDAYEGQDPPAKRTPIASCTRISTGGNFIVTRDIGSDPTTMCLQLSFPSNSVNIDLGGHTVSGSIRLSTNRPSDVIFHGTITCDIPYNGGACLTWAAPSGRIHHITIENTNSNPLANINVTGTTAASNTSPLLRIDHVTSTVVAAPHSNRTRNFMDDGANGSNPVSLPEEVDHNLITCSDNASACQGVEMWDAPNSYVHNNLIVLPSNCSLCNDSARGILFDSRSSGEAAYNSILTRGNRAVRVRSPIGSSNLAVNIHDNAFQDIEEQGRLAAIHVGENDASLTDIIVNVFNNTFELGPSGNGVVSSAASNMNVYDNSVTCLNDDCSKVGFFALTDVPAASYAQTGTTITVGNNNVSSLTAAGKPSIKVCGPAGNSSYQCAGSNTATSTAIVCSSGNAVGNGTINLDQGSSRCR